MIDFSPYIEFEVLGEDETCSSNRTTIHSSKMCARATSSLKSDGTTFTFGGDVSYEGKPRGCYILIDPPYNKLNVYFNTHPDGSRAKDAKPVCISCEFPLVLIIG